MLLAINCNNTNTVFSVWDKGEMRGVWRTATEARRTADEYVVWLEQLMTLSGLARGEIDATIIASVVPEADFNLLRLVDPLFQVGTAHRRRAGGRSRLPRTRRPARGGPVPTGSSTRSLPPIAISCR